MFIKLVLYLGINREFRKRFLNLEGVLRRMFKRVEEFRCLWGRG